MLQARLAGTCYPAEREALLQSVRGWFDQPDGTPWIAANGHTPPPPGANHWQGLISPHIDFRVNTGVYASAFGPWLAQPPADKILILGVGHRARQEWSFDGRSYVTPLGPVATDKAGLAQLARNLPHELWADSRAHVGEHSIEFPLICLQSMRALRGIETPFEFVPLLCGGLFEYVGTDRLPEPNALLFRLAAALRSWWQETEAAGHRVEMVVSIDGCHMGPRFGHEFLVDEACLADCATWESELWKRVEAGDLNHFLRFLQQDGNSRYFDGVGALGLVLAMFGDQSAGLIRRTGYAQWFTEEDGSTVTFSSGALEKKSAT